MQKNAECNIFYYKMSPYKTEFLTKNSNMMESLRISMPVIVSANSTVQWHHGGQKADTFLTDTVNFRQNSKFLM